jgi:hypothetical protein
MSARTTYTLEVRREGHDSDRGCDYKTRAGRTYVLEVERGGDVSDRGCNYITKVGTTYGLEVEREGDLSDRGSDYKTRVGMTYSLGWKERTTCQIAVVTTNEGTDDIHTGGGEGDVSDHGCD